MSKKINKILFVGSKDRYNHTYQNWYEPLKRKCEKLVSFDAHWTTICYGESLMNQKFIEFIKKEKPDHIFFVAAINEFSFDTLLKIRKIIPKTQTFIALGDEDTRFESFSRYIMLFLDYGMITQKGYLKKYKKEGIKNIFYYTGINTCFFKPFDLEKKYDITFIGRPLSEKSKRPEFIKFLKNNKINIKLFGWGWNEYPEFKKIYGGPLDKDEMVKIINQGKINLCFSRNVEGKTHFKDRIHEINACKSFALAEYSKNYLDFLKQGKEIITFKNKKELLSKIDYYLKNEKEREKIAETAYEKTIKEYSMDAKLKKIFKEVYKTNKNLTHKELPKINKKIFLFLKKDLNKKPKELKKTLKDYDYISFDDRNCKNLKYKKYLQAYSLEKTKKQISCCDYYVYTKSLGDYLEFSTKSNLKKINKEKFDSFLNINQLMVTKKYFLENIEKFKRGFRKEIDFINENNTTFVSFPLIRISKVQIKDYETMKKSFIFKFIHQLYSLKHRKKIFTSIYLPKLFLEIIKGKTFILKSIVETLKSKDRKKRLDLYKAIKN